MKRIISMILACLMLTACAKTPENVKSQKHYENSEVNVTTEMIAPKDLQSSSENALNIQQKQFRIDGVKLDLPSKLSLLELTQISGFEGNCEKVFDDMLGKDIWHSEKIVKQQASEQNPMTAYSFRNESKKLYGCVGDNGFITFIKPECFDDPYTVQAETVKVYDVSKGELSGDRYRLADGEYSIVSVQKLFEGVPLDDIMIMHGSDDPKVKNSVSKLDLTIHKRADISSFTNGVGIVKPSVRQEVNELLSLQSVMDICKNKFSAYNEIRVKSIGLKYTVEPVYSENDKYKKAYYDAGRKFTSHILWELVAEMGEQDKSDNKIRYIYADAQTGEIEFDFDGVTIG